MLTGTKDTLGSMKVFKCYTFTQTTKCVGKLVYRKTPGPQPYMTKKGEEVKRPSTDPVMCELVACEPVAGPSCL